jgi:hypothetical protein
MSEGVDETEALADLEGMVQRKVVEGFESADEIVDGVCEAADDEYPRLQARPIVTRLVAAALAAARESERSWPAVTDCDRLDRAFARLESGRILARQHFTCCQTCGHSEMADELATARQRGPVIGYTFFHVQDTESAAEGGGLYLAYGSAGQGEDEAPDAGLAVARQVVEALRAEGLTPEWNGQQSQRIFLPMTWQKRRSLLAGKPWWQFWGS